MMKFIISDGIKILCQFSGIILLKSFVSLRTIFIWLISKPELSYLNFTIPLQ